jgi:hypothetical protein
MFSGLVALAWNAPIFEMGPTRVLASADAGVPYAGEHSSAVEIARDIATVRATAAAGDKMATRMAIAAALAVLIKLLVEALQKMTDVSAKAMKAIPIICTALGGVYVVLARFAAGEDWVNAVIVGAAPLGSVAINELHNALKPTPPAIAQPIDKPAPPTTPPMKAA